LLEELLKDLLEYHPFLFINKFCIPCVLLLSNSCFVSYVTNPGDRNNKYDIIFSNNFKLPGSSTVNRLVRKGNYTIKLSKKNQLIIYIYLLINLNNFLKNLSSIKYQKCLCINKLELTTTPSQKDTNISMCSINSDSGIRINNGFS
jgi:hypothetical protein